MERTEDLICLGLKRKQRGGWRNIQKSSPINANTAAKIILKNIKKKIKEFWLEEMLVGMTEFKDFSKKIYLFVTTYTPNWKAISQGQAFR